ncbi:MAG: insulinase family protein [Holosporaceae bacterium]|nr:insulinase family protein [Holosporaceae bacterium]
MNRVFGKLILMVNVFFSVWGNEKSARVEEITSPEGIEFWYLYENTPLVQIFIAFRNAGAAYQEKSKAGVPVFFSRTVFCGSGKYSSTQFKEECSNLAVKISASAGADNLYYTFTSPKIVLDEAIFLLNMAITSPNFEEDKVKIIQNSIGSSLQNYAASPSEIAFSSMIPARIFKHHAYGYGKYGSPENFMKISIEDLKYFKSKFIVRSNAVVCIVGDISKEEAASLVDKVFQGVEKGEASQDHIEDIAPELDSEVKKYYADGPQSSIFFVLKSEPPQSAKRYAVMILYKILGEGQVFRGRILSKLRTESGLIYGGTVHYVDMKHANYILGELRTDNSKVMETIDLLKVIIKDLRENGISESELQFAKNNIKGRMLVGLRTSENLCSFYFYKKLQGYKTAVLEETIQRICRVQLEEVNSLAKEMLDENKMPIIVIGGAKK